MKHLFTVLIIALFATSIIFTSPALGIVDSPRKQMENGILAEDVICKNELQLMLRANGSAICVKPASIERLVTWGLAEIVDIPTRDLEKNEEQNTEEETVVTDVDISPEKILVHSEHLTYDLDSTMVFTGTVQPNLDLEVSLEDSNGNKVYVDILEIDNSGQVYLEVTTDESFDEGKYFLILKQNEDSEIIPVLIGEPTIDIAVVVEKFHFDLNSQATLEIFGPNSSSLAMTILNSKNEIQFEDTIHLEPTGYAEYLLDLSGYKRGVYFVMMNYASEQTIEEFTVGLSTGVAPIEIIIDDDYYKLGETITLVGESTDNTRILIELADPSGEIVDKIEYYTGDDGKFVNLIEIPFDKQPGIWKIQVSNAERISELNFEVIS